MSEAKQPEKDPFYEGRELAPAARYAATETPGVRWHDTVTGQEQFAAAVGVDDLLDAGADPSDAEDETRLIQRIKISPNARTGGWSVRVSRIRLDPHIKGGAVKFLGTQTYARTETFEDREAAVEHAAEQSDAFADADVRDAAAWYRNRRAAREAEQ